MAADRVIHSYLLATLAMGAPIAAGGAPERAPLELPPFGDFIGQHPVIGVPSMDYRLLHDLIAPVDEGTAWELNGHRGTTTHPHVRVTYGGQPGLPPRRPLPIPGSAWPFHR